MQKNLYFRSLISRKNVLLAAILDFFLNLASYPRLVIEVFIRKNFGQRYFSMASAITISFILLLLPPLFDKMSSLYRSYGPYGYGQEETSFWVKYATWYAFIVGFIFFSYKRSLEIKRNPSVFDFGKYSLYSGDIDLRFYQFKLFGKTPTVRTIETLYEPALVFIIGVVLELMDQKVGNLLTWCSVFYCLSYVGAYKKGDDFIMDLIDEMIMNEELQTSFVEDEFNNARGVRFYMDKPTSREAREKLANRLVVDDEPIFAL